MRGAFGYLEPVKKAKYRGDVTGLGSFHNGMCRELWIFCRRVTLDAGFREVAVERIAVMKFSAEVARPF